MKNLSIKQHLGIAVLILVVLYTLFTLFHPAFLPHPEDFSPWPDLAAFLALLWACIKLRKQPHAWAYWGIFLVCTLAGLDEIGYGTEIFGWPSLYLPKYHIEIHDLHNLINLGIQLVQMRLNALHWNGTQFEGFLLLDTTLFLLGCLFLRLLRFPAAPVTESQWQDRILRLVAGSVAVLGGAAVIYLFTLPADPKNAFLFGHSLVRLASAAFILVLSLSPLIFVNFKRAGFQKIIAQRLKKTSFSLELPSFLFVLMFLAVAYQFYVSFIFLPDQVALFERITPLIQWALAEIFIIWLAAMVWAGHYRKPFADLWHRFVAFNTREPAFFYAAFAVMLIFIAQLIDADVIPLNDWIKTPDFHVQLWGLWTEEVFEMTSGFIFLVSSFFFPYNLLRQKTIKKD